MAELSDGEYETLSHAGVKSVCCLNSLVINQWLNSLIQIVRSVIGCWSLTVCVTNFVTAYLCKSRIALINELHLFVTTCD